MPKFKKHRENQKKQKKQYSRTLAKVKMQKSKKPRENQKKQKKQYSRIGSTGKSPGILFFFVFFCFLEVLDFCIFTFARVLEYCFFLVFLVFSRFFEFWHFYFCRSPGILFSLVFLFFFGFLEVSKKQRFYQSPQKFLEFWKTKLVFGKFAKLKKHLSCAKIQKSQDYAYDLEYFWNFRKTPLFAIYPFLLCLSFVFMY